MTAKLYHIKVSVRDQRAVTLFLKLYFNRAYFNYLYNFKIKLDKSVLKLPKVSLNCSLYFKKHCCKDKQKQHFLEQVDKLGTLRRLIVNYFLFVFKFMISSVKVCLDLINGLFTQSSIFSHFVPNKKFYVE